MIPIVGQILGPLFIWLLKRQDSIFIDEQGVEAINFQISITIYAIPCFILVIFMVGIPLLFLLFVFWFVMVFYAAVQANNGISYRYPLCFRFL